MTSQNATLVVTYDPRLIPAAGASVLAHLLDLQERGLVQNEQEEWAVIKDQA